MRATCASSANGHVNAFQPKNGGKIHGNGGIHGFENGPGTHQRGIFFLANRIYGLYHGQRHTVVAIKKANFVRIQIILINFRLFERIDSGDVGISLSSPILTRWRRLSIFLRSGFGTFPVSADLKPKSLRSGSKIIPDLPLYKEFFTSSKVIPMQE